jgi:GNAT superfamily N-acetyltransferase
VCIKFNQTASKIRRADGSTRSLRSIGDAFRYLPVPLGAAPWSWGPLGARKISSRCALWFPPETGPEEDPLISVIENSISPDHHAEVFAVFAAMGEVHPMEPHWYLPLIGVEASCQGSGRGAALLRETLALCDRDGMPAYLEASSPRSIPLHERFGFRRRELLQVGNCPPITPMWRPATKLHGLRPMPIRLGKLLTHTSENSDPGVDS